jgi:hypothetical protein
MFISIKDRFSKGLNANVTFQKEEKEKQKNTYFAHLDSIRKYAKNLSERVENEINENDKRLTHRLKMKGIAQWSYEHVLIYNLFFFLYFNFIFFHFWRKKKKKLFFINSFNIFYF